MRAANRTKLFHPSAPTANGRRIGPGFLLVTAYSDRWGTDDFPPSGRTVWAELSAAGGPA